MNEILCDRFTIKQQELFIYSFCSEETANFIKLNYKADTRTLKGKKLKRFITDFSILVYYDRTQGLIKIFCS